jgi:hypothetical protein
MMVLVFLLMPVMCVALVRCVWLVPVLGLAAMVLGMTIVAFEMECMVCVVLGLVLVLCVVPRVAVGLMLVLVVLLGCVWLL